MGITVVLVVALAATSLVVRAAQAPLSQLGVDAVPTGTATPSVQATPTTTAPFGFFTTQLGGMWGRMGGRMGGMMARMGGRMWQGSANGGTQGPMGMMGNGVTTMPHETMMGTGVTSMPHETIMPGMTPGGVAPMYEDTARMLGMTAQELYDHMAAGQSMVQIAAEKGITEQELMDGMMAGRKAAFDQAVKDGFMTQMYADTQLENLKSNLKEMVNDPGYGSGGWGMMWDQHYSP
jgi:hypothetical protein